MEVDPQDVQEGYQKAFEEHHRKVSGMALGSGCEYEPIDTRTPYPEVIRSYLRVRQGGLT